MMGDTSAIVLLLHQRKLIIFSYANHKEQISTFFLDPCLPRCNSQRFWIFQFDTIFTRFGGHGYQRHTGRHRVLDGAQTATGTCLRPIIPFPETLRPSRSSPLTAP